MSRRFTTIIATLAVVLPFSGKAQGSTDFEEIWSRLPNSLAQCAAAYDLLSHLEQVAGNINSTEASRDMGNGAELTASVVLMLSGLPKEVALSNAQERRRAHLVYLKAMIERDKFDEVTVILGDCTDLYLPIQINIVEKLRAYESRGTTDSDLWYSMMWSAIEEWISELPPEQARELYSIPDYP